MASASGKGKNGGVMEDQPKVVEYELVRSRNLEENERRMEVIRKKELLCGKIWKQTANQKRKERYVASITSIFSAKKKM